ncbi:MAG: hypothetical protein K2I75_03690 [Clostridiales bacterium]|nr:hypothetical protein [Clostridiales bacterium]
MKKLDKTLSVIILVAYAVLWVISWIMAYASVPAGVITGMAITRTVVLCLMYVVVLYNALGWTDNLILRIVFIGLALFLIASAIAMQVPEVYSYIFGKYGIPLMV